MLLLHKRDYILIFLIFNIFMFFKFKLSLFYQGDGILLHVSCVLYYYIILFLSQYQYKNY